MKKKIVFLLPFAVLAIGAYLLFFSAKAQNDKAAIRAAAVPVSVADVVVKDVSRIVEVSGRAEASESVTLKSRIDGQVSAVPFTEGQHVSQGDVLIRLDAADMALRLHQAEANLARDQAAANKANSDVERYVSLREKGFVSDEKVGEIRNTAAAQTAALKASQSALQLARNQQDYTTIRSPFSGIVGAKLVYPGAAVKIADTALAVVNRVSPLNVSFSLSEKYLAQIKAMVKQGGMQVRLLVPGQDGEVVGYARFIDNAVDVTTGTIRVKAAIPNLDERFAAGQMLSVKVALEQLPKAVVVPAEAVQQGQAGSYVYVVNADTSQPAKNGKATEKVAMAPVVVLATQGKEAIISSGLKGGETVVIDGHLRLSPGAVIQRVSGLPLDPQRVNREPTVSAPASSASPAISR